MCYSLQLRSNGIFYFRKRIPTDLVNRLGKTEITKSLKTANKAEAIRLLPKIEPEIQNYFISVKSGKAPAIEPLLYKAPVIETEKDLTLSNILQRWEKQNNPANSTLLEWNSNVKQFTELFGNVNISEVTTRNIIAFKDVISKVPARYLYTTSCRQQSLWRQQVFQFYH